MRILSVLLIICLAEQARAEPSSLSQIRAARKALFCESCAGGRLKVFANFKLSIVQNNLAIGGDYFPVTDLTGKITNLLTWREESWRAGNKYRMRVFSPLPKEYTGKMPGNYDLTLWHNGESSWKYRPIDKEAQKSKGIDRPSQITQDYYGDLVGSVIPSDVGLFKRILQNSSELTFDLDQLLSQNLYSVLGEETFSGESCTIIDRPGLDRVWLAQDKSYSIVKREWRWEINGPLKRRITNRDFHDLGDGVWLPFAGEMEIYSHPTTPPERKVGVLYATVESASTSFSDSDFTPDFPRGTSVFDEVTRETSWAGFSAEENAAKSAKKALGKVKTLPPAEVLAFKNESSSWRFWFAGISAAIVIATILYLRLRKGGDW